LPIKKIPATCIIGKKIAVYFQQIVELVSHLLNVVRQKKAYFTQTFVDEIDP